MIENFFRNYLEIVFVHFPHQVIDKILNFLKEGFSDEDIF